MNDAIRRILVPIDGSLGSESVFPAIMPLVRAYGPEVYLLHVFENPEKDAVPSERVRAACLALRTAGVKASLHLREGAPAAAILASARNLKVDVIALSTQGRSGIRRLFGGSVAEEVLRGSEVPVLLTRPGVTVHDLASVAVALDGSETAEEILPEAVRLTRKLGSSLQLVQVGVPIVTSVAGEGVVALPPLDPLPYLRGVLSRLRAQGVQASAVALEGHPARELLRYLVEEGVTLLCMTTHGRSGLTRLLLGSVAEEIVRRAPCPVLLRRTVPLEPAAGVHPLRTATAI